MGDVFDWGVVVGVAGATCMCAGETAAGRRQVQCGSQPSPAAKGFVWSHQRRRKGILKERGGVGGGAGEGVLAHTYSTEGVWAADAAGSDFAASQAALGAAAGAQVSRGLAQRHPFPSRRGKLKGWHPSLRR